MASQNAVSLVQGSSYNNSQQVNNAEFRGIKGQACHF